MLAYHHLGHRILYGGLVELIVNAMTGVRPGFIDWEWRSQLSRSDQIGRVVLGTTEKRR
jgi:hypothetical protein